jgi:D-glycero-alpha-D-manno-heptose 1-phosphate guanylyltransferase
MLEAIILAGGFGTRLRQIVPDLPKPMAPVSGRPFLEILLSSLLNKGFSRIVVSLGFMAEKIINHFGNNFRGVEIVYVVEGKPLGTGGAIRLSLESCRQENIFVFNGDTYLNLEIEQIEKQWQKHQSSIIVGRMVEDTARYGRLIVQNQKIVAFTEKGATGSGLINAGCYLIKKNELKTFPLQTAFSFETEYLAKKVLQTPFDLFVTEGVFIDIGIPEDYAKAQILLAEI